ncbi:MAG: DUF1003 domain-containing protein [Patescibacteria group bacterium]|nr:DUF1003 domain-containing protein [Patescibacteria group bacterium]
MADKKEERPSHQKRATWHYKFHESRTPAQKFADLLAQGMGSWPFIIWQTVFVVFWIFLNLYGYTQHWDPYPFILLNLLFSTQAAYAAPIIMMSQNRQADKDRLHAEEDFETNRKAKEEIEMLQTRLDEIESKKLDKILAILEKK